MDVLLFDSEPLEWARPVNPFKMDKGSVLVFGILDMLALILLFPPLFGQQRGVDVQSVSLMENSLLQMLYLLTLLAISGLGVLELVSGMRKYQTLFPGCSTALHTLAVLLFAISRQPYVTVCLFLLTMGKMTVMVQKIPKRKG